MVVTASKMVRLEVRMGVCVYVGRVGWIEEGCAKRLKIYTLLKF